MINNIRDYFATPPASKRKRQTSSLALESISFSSLMNKATIIIPRNSSQKELIRPFIDMNALANIKKSETKIGSKLVKLDNLLDDDQKKEQKVQDEKDEKVKMKNYWRQLSKWQAFEDYQFLRDPLNVKESRGVDSLEYNDVVEPINFSDGVKKAVVDNLLIPKENYNFVQRKSQQVIERFQSLHEPGYSNSVYKHNSLIYRREFLENESPSIPRVRASIAMNHKTKKLIQEVYSLLNQLQYSLVHEDIQKIAPITQRLVQVQWRIGIFNFFALGSFIHCLILQMHGKSQLAYTNWRRYIRVCNFQGPKMHKYKLVAYKYLAKISLSLVLYDKVILYLKKMLKLAWSINDQNFELLAYDLFSIVYYHMQDIAKSKFFHEKFAAGESEAKMSKVRSIAEQNYSYTTNKKERLSNHESSSSEDDLDLDQLIKNAQRVTIEKQQKQDKLQDFLRSTFKPQYEKGSMFSKVKRLNHSVIDEMNCFQILKQFKQNHEPLGPINKMRQTHSNSIERTQVKFFLNSKSNKVLENYLNHDIMKPKDNSKVILFEQTNNLKMMLKIFCYDVKHQSAHHKLFQNGFQFII